MPGTTTRTPQITPTQRNSTAIYTQSINAYSVFQEYQQKSKNSDEHWTFNDLINNSKKWNDTMSKLQPESISQQSSSSSSSTKKKKKVQSTTSKVTVQKDSTDKNNSKSSEYTKNEPKEKAANGTTNVSSQINVSETYKNYNPTNVSEFVGDLKFFDARLYKSLALYNRNDNGTMPGTLFYPHQGYFTYVSDMHETPQAAANRAEYEAKNDSEARKVLEQHAQSIAAWNSSMNDNYLAPMSLMHPYAVISLSGASGGLSTLAKRLTYDQYSKRRWYEIDGNQAYSGHYAKQPTTTALIKWGNESDRGATPYSFQDFVFCKYWNKIENNRLITLRRYAAPVTDDISFKDYKINHGDETEKNSSTSKNDNASSSDEIKIRTIERGDEPWVPLATAVTYFGDETGNKLSDILAFSAKYNWKKMSSEKDPILVNSTQNDMGEDGGGLVGKESNILTSGLGVIGRVLGFAKDVKNGNTINLDAARKVPPDPYMHGPYENRILGPVNVIMDTYKRERGLKFTQDNIKIKFEYVARPIAGINSKAVLLDCLANILVMTYSHGTWFGGMWKYNCSKPALFPWVGGDEMNALYHGKIFGKDGFVNKLTETIANHGSYIGTLFKGMADTFNALVKGASNLFNSIINGVAHDNTNYELKEQYKVDWDIDRYLVEEKGFQYDDSGNRTENGQTISKETDKATFNTEFQTFKQNANNAYNDEVARREQMQTNTSIQSAFDEATNSGFGKSIQKVIAAKLLKGSTVPYLENNRALLTGDVVGDWHLTIGNPFNPIAMIGNLICTDCNIKFSDELGPDDFPIGFTATITLNHGLGRDREAIESMFNRGRGRIYTLPSSFRSSADGETKVDDYTGKNGQQGSYNYQEKWNTFFPGNALTRGIINKEESPLKNKGQFNYSSDTNNMQSLSLKKGVDTHSAFTVATTYINPWHTAMVL